MGGGGGGGRVEERGSKGFIHFFPSPKSQLSEIAIVVEVSISSKLNFYLAVTASKS